MGLLKFTRRDGEGYRSEIQEYKDTKPEDARNGVRKEATPTDAAHDGESKPYDEWEAIQRELALYPDQRDKDDMVIS